MLKYVQKVGGGCSLTSLYLVVHDQVELAAGDELEILIAPPCTVSFLKNDHDA